MFAPLYGKELEGNHNAFRGGCMREMSMHGHDDGFRRSNETVARLVAYLGPYLFWGTMGIVAGGIWLLQ